MAPGLPRIVGGGGSLPHPPCEAKRATAVACTILPIEGSPAAASPVCWVLLGVGTQAVAGLAGFFQLRVALGGDTHLPDAPVPASGTDGAPPRPAVPIRATRSTPWSIHRRIELV